jgi:hypothetical protein
MTLRPSINPGRGREHAPGSSKDLEPGKEATAHGHAGHEAGAVDLLASPERPEVCAAALTGARAGT